MAPGFEPIAVEISIRRGVDKTAVPGDWERLLAETRVEDSVVLLSDANGQPACGATALGQTLLLTAAHCACGGQGLRLDAKLLSADDGMRWCMENKPCSSMAVGYLNSVFDIALVVLDKPFWGRNAQIATFTGHSYPEMVLLGHRGERWLKPRLVCRTVPRLGDVETPATPADLGDSGGPVVAFRKDSREAVVLGVLSNGDGTTAFFTPIPRSLATPRRYTGTAPRVDEFDDAASFLTICEE